MVAGEGKVAYQVTNKWDRSYIQSANMTAEYCYVVGKHSKWSPTHQVTSSDADVQQVTPDLSACC
jgi:hypothetical protein